MRRRCAYTLIELLVAIGSASVLMVGLSSTLYIASQALDLDSGAGHGAVRAEAALARVVSDARDATRFRELTDTAITFDTPDRDNDGAPETIRYAWGGSAGDPLTRELNGGAAVTLLAGVDSLDFGWIARSVTAQDVTVTPPPAWPIVEGVSAVATTTSQTNRLWINTPADTVAGELLIAVLAVEGDQTSSLYAMGNWTLIGTQSRDNDVTLAVYHKSATAGGQPSQGWGWGSDAHGTGYILRISNVSTASPIDTFGTHDGDKQKPEVPSVTSTVDYGLVLRIGAFQNASIVEGDPGLSGHTGLVMTQAGGAVSSGCGYRVWKPSGSVAASEFTLTNQEKYAAMTLVIAPDPEAAL